LMTAQLANGGYKIYPKIKFEKNQDSAEQIKNKMVQKAIEKEENGSATISPIIKPMNFLKTEQKKHSILYRNPENVKFVLDAMWSSTNEVMGTSFGSRIDDKKYQFAGKTGTSQVKKITARHRELELKAKDVPYEERDHALYIAFGPYKNPRYAISIIVEHGGSGSSTAAPMAKKLFKLIIDRHEEREKIIKQNLTIS